MSTDPSTSKNKSMRIVAIILTRDESIHIERCIRSLPEVISEILVVDCGSNDDTVTKASRLGAKVIFHKWTNYASQFNWALTQLNDDTDWVLRIDADEYLTLTLANEIKTYFCKLECNDVNGIFFSRRMTFQGQLIRYGGIFPVRVLRLFRFGCGECENRWMDEHIKVIGPTIEFNGELIDDNLNSLTWWVDKHNKYASREAVDLLNLEYGFMPHDSVANLRGGSQAGMKRWLKEVVYFRLPGGFRALVYFFYRYFVRCGFLDGTVGSTFHFLQGFWYRYLVDAKVAEVRRYIKKNGCGIQEAIVKVLNIKV
ncbi:glycosyltransferase family 2 protein [Nitrosomonas oligotropha]|uniref:Glycosyltransferase involved in cell wall bisynthesis n=1 Tax=Nitrosomonas oligotropha TaxID=42354 RepID=A0A1H8PJB2_9PROT|nr:glycosyltransferase family 2 protein [Nitrosomonas oligotropha]SDW79450.1 Glycosyltransferase involved in cell wall bisynthesis [Nitrosomonas oligotropha]SEO42020.1 Glycosyltransferase involved in cell wall bisynthesis [Nitrosomonas oligotropha]